MTYYAVTPLQSKVSFASARSLMVAVVVIEIGKRMLQHGWLQTGSTALAILLPLKPIRQSYSLQNYSNVPAEALLRGYHM